MKFLVENSKALAPHRTVIAQLKKNMGGMEWPRDHKTVHASDVTKPGFCARQLCLLDHYDRQRPKQYVPMALRATYDVGELTARLVRERWLGDAAIGNWECHRCKDQRSFCPKPELGGCKSSGQHDWGYREVVFFSPVYDISASMDVLVQLGAPQVTLTELKIIKPEDWDKLLAPLVEHHLRTNLYLHIIKTSDSPHKDFVNTTEARVLYVSRAYGKKNTTHNEVMPFKEFVVKANDAALISVLADASKVKKYREQKVFPIGVCKTHADLRAKSCNVSKECWGGMHPGYAL